MAPQQVFFFRNPNPCVCIQFFLLEKRVLLKFFFILEKKEILFSKGNFIFLFLCLLFLFFLFFMFLKTCISGEKIREKNSFSENCCLWCFPFFERKVLIFHFFFISKNLKICFFLSRFLMKIFWSMTLFDFLTSLQILKFDWILFD